MKGDIFKKVYSIGEILSDAWMLFKKNFKLILWIILIVFVPLNIINELVSMSAQADPAMGIFAVGPVFASIIITSLIGIVATLAIAFVVKYKIENKEIDLGEALKKGFSRWLPALGTSILAGIFLMGLYLLLIVPGIIFSVYWTFIVYVVALNNKSGLAALKHSKAIVKGRWWKVVGYSFVFGLIAGGVMWGIMLVIGLPLSILTLFIGENIIVNVVLSTITDIALSFFTVLSIVFFINFDNNRVQKIEEKQVQKPSQAKNPY